MKKVLAHYHLKILSNNLEDISSFINYDIEDIIGCIEPSIKITLLQKQKLSLYNELKKYLQTIM
ncbi:hypothetical protein ACTPDT_17120 [Clostridioides difficile]|uniref:Uncharacterized protein n=1 Tax=Clostridioides difficile TaxID=1496 RepID=A0A9P3YRT9_CLODI|nr:hypothetical protein [Clostridioides difficile]EHJ26612.1 hypothetical protein HMPREF1123_03117 [Clostridioides difficile 050-P50-2011]CCL03950.1 hypothetical protein BN167_2080024 [Clostridioides difficile E13]CCL08897.1 hypothetical protein BN168_680024 [Clostridioides difficile CD002]AWH79235.1 hypothetical protein DDG61_19205 [Clostridioides difficile]AWH83132.1 hypothetical protein DDG63_19655 [Clostridioides difficile]